MTNKPLAASLLVALFCGTSASAQHAPRVQVGGGLGWALPSPEAVLIDSSFFPDVRVGPSQTLDTRTEFVKTATDWFGDLVVYVAPRVGIMGQVAEMWAEHPIFVQSKGIINYTRSTAFVGGGRVNLHCCNKAVPFVYGLAGPVLSRSHVNIGDPSINTPFQGPSDTSLGMAFGGGVETPGRVRFRVTTDLITASRQNTDTPNWTWRVNAGLAIAIH